MGLNRSLEFSALFAAVLVCSCGGESSVEKVTVRDSAGVTIVESSAPLWEAGAGWTLSEQPILQVGAVDGPAEYQFESIEALLRLEGGAIIVADGGASEIRVYDEAGVFVDGAGREGDAPGEYRQLISVGAGPGDSLWAYDFGNRRFTVIAEHMRVARTVSVGGTLSSVSAVGRMSDGSFIIREFWSSGPRTGEIQLGLLREPAAVARLSSDGSQLDTIGLFPGREIYVSRPDGRAIMSSPLFAHTASAAMWGDRVFLGTQESFEIGLYAVDGRLERVNRVIGVDLSISEEDIEREIEADLARVPEARRPNVRRHLEEMHVPETRPAYGDLMVDGAGNLWAAENKRFPQLPRFWTVFDSEGALLGQVDMPERFRLYAAGDDWVLGVWMDGMDVEYVRVYSIRK